MAAEDFPAAGLAEVGEEHSEVGAPTLVPILAVVIPTRASAGRGICFQPAARKKETNSRFLLARCARALE